MPAPAADAQAGVGDGPDFTAFVRTAPAGPRPRHSRWLGPVLAVLTIGLAVAVTYEPPTTDRAFDPASRDRAGLAATVDVLRELGVDVTVSGDLADAADADTVLLPPLPGWTRDDAVALARAGARVVAAVPPDPEAVVNPIAFTSVGLVTLEVDCPLLPDVAELRSVEWPGWQQDVAVAVPAADRCLTFERSAWLTRVEVGQGELLALSTMAPLVNARFVDSDAAVAVVRLLAPTGTERVLVLGERDGLPEVTLADLVDRRWFDAAWLSLGLLVVLALSRGRRLGAPVSEQLPVRVPSGELARAIGDLRHRAGHDAASTAALRERTRVLLARRLGVPPGQGLPAVVEALEHAGVELTTDERDALLGPELDDPDALVARSRALATLRRRIAGAGPVRLVPPPTPPTPTTADEGAPR